MAVSSISSALGVAGKGIGGLATGLNTDELVEALTSGTRSKIAQQGQQKQLLNWKINAYRTMSTALTAFQTKFLKISTSTSSNTNITSSKFFNTYKSTSSSDKVSVSATSGATAGNFTIDKVSQLATSESYSSTKKMSSSLNLEIKSSDIKEGMFTGQTLKLEVDGFTTKTIKLDDLNQYITKTGTPTTTTVHDDETGEDIEVTTEGPPYTYSMDMGDFKEGLQKLLNETYKSSGVITVGLDGNNITLDSKSARITVNTSNTLLGADAGDSNRVDTDMKLGTLDAFSNVQGDELVFNINGVNISVNKRDTIDDLLTKVTNSGAGVRMTYDQYNDVFTLTSTSTGADSSFEMRDVQGNLLSEIFGAKGGSSVGSEYLTTGDGISIGSKFTEELAKMTKAEKKELGEKLANMSFQLTINGDTKTVRLDTTLGINATKLADGSFTAEDIYSAINKGIESAFPKAGITVGEGMDGRTVFNTSLDEAFSVSANGEFAKMLGLNTTGASFTAGNTVSNLGYAKTISSSPDTESGYLDATKLTGSFEMTINGVTKTVTVTPAKDSKGKEIAITNDNYLSRLNAAVKSAFGDDAADVSFSATYDKMDGYQQLVNPSEYTEKEDGYYKYFDDLGEEVKVYDKAPEGKPEGYYKNGVMVADAEGDKVDANGKKIVITQKTLGLKLSLNVASGTFGAVETSVSMRGDLSDTMGFTSATKTEATNASDSASSVKLGDLKGGANMASGSITVNGETVAYDKTTTLEDFLTELNDKLGDKGAAGIQDGKLFIKTEDGDLSISDTGGMLETLFGVKGGTFETAKEDYTSKYAYETEKNADGTVKKDEDGNPVYVIAKDEGGNEIYDDDGNPVYQAASTRSGAQNAILTIDGREFEWSSNTVSYNGVNLTLNDVSTEKITIGVQADVEDVVTRIKEWMDDYNALVYTLNSAINESKNLDYSPLTDEQKADMTEDQVKTWETEAKKGLLRNDSTLRQILADMRNALYTKVESAGISLYDIGIVTKSGLSDMNQAGQLEFDQNVTGGGEERLRSMLTDNPDKVRMLFSDSNNGIGTQLNTIITRAANPSSVDRGTLVRIAGTEQLTGDNTSQLKNKITALDKYIAQLKSRLETEHSRYWKQFSSLETAVQKMNTQSSWLTSQ